jgi:hypothetical protein
LTEQGPDELIRRIRRAENDGTGRHRHKRYDDATAAVCHFGDIAP